MEMRYLITARRRYGVAIPAQQLSKVQPIRGDVHIGESVSEQLGRPSLTAWIFVSSPSMPDPLPPLLDVRVTGMAQNGMNLNGVEEVDGVLYAQSWLCKVE
jgi:hypothetical protein